MNFLDPTLTKDGKPYGPIRYKQLVQECYVISRNINTSYSDILRMTPTERGYLLEFLYNEFKRNQEALKAAKNK